MRHPHEQLQSATQIATEHREARARLEAANSRFARAVAEHARLTGLTTAAIEEDPSGEALEAALGRAESDYRGCLMAMKTDASDAARWRCARALIEFDRMSELVSSRRAR